MSIQTILTTIVMGEVLPRPSLNLLLQRLDFIQGYWYEVGETLNVSDGLLHELQNSPQSVPQSERNLEAVIVGWIEENQSQILLPLIVEALRDAQFVRQDHALLERLNNIPVPNRRNVVGKCIRHYIYIYTL